MVYIRFTGSGKTTVLALAYIDKAISQQGHWISLEVTGRFHTRQEGERFKSMIAEYFEKQSFVAGYKLYFRETEMKVEIIPSELSSFKFE